MPSLSTPALGGGLPHAADNATSLRLVSLDPRAGGPAPSFPGEVLAIRTTGRGWASGSGGACYLLVGVEVAGALAWRSVSVGTPWPVLDCMGAPVSPTSWVRCGGVPS